MWACPENQTHSLLLPVCREAPEKPPYLGSLENSHNQDPATCLPPTPTIATLLSHCRSPLSILGTSRWSPSHSSVRGLSYSLLL